MPRRLPSPAITENLYFAILPDDAAKARIAALLARLQSQFGLMGRRVPAECLHVSLQSLGAHSRARPDIIAVGKRAGAAIAAATFPVTFDRVLSFGAGYGDRSIVLSGAQRLDTLSNFHTALGDQMKLAGLGHYVRRPFAPHVTLLYRKQPIDPIDVRPITWTARELVLVQSLYGQSQHIHLGRWKLRG